MAVGTDIHLPPILTRTASIFSDGVNLAVGFFARVERLGGLSSSSASSSLSSSVSSSLFSSSDCLISSLSFFSSCSSVLGLRCAAFMTRIFFLCPDSRRTLYVWVPVLSITMAGSHLGPNFLLVSCGTRRSTQTGSPALKVVGGEEGTWLC